jgi:hypothetical protein
MNWKFGLRPRHFFSGNICFKLSAFCLCSALPYAGVDYIPQSGTKNFAAGQVSPLEAEFVEVADPLATTVRHTTRHIYQSINQTAQQSVNHTLTR